MSENYCGRPRSAEERCSGCAFRSTASVGFWFFLSKKDGLHFEEQKELHFSHKTKRYMLEFQHSRVLISHNSHKATVVSPPLHITICSVLSIWNSAAVWVIALQSLLLLNYKLEGWLQNWGITADWTAEFASQYVLNADLSSCVSFCVCACVLSGRAQRFLCFMGPLLRWSTTTSTMLLWSCKARCAVFLSLLQCTLCSFHVFVHVLNCVWRLCNNRESFWTPHTDTTDVPFTLEV